MNAMSDEIRHAVHIPYGAAATCECGWASTGGTPETAGHQHIVAAGWQVIGSPKLNGDVDLIPGRRIEP